MSEPEIKFIRESESDDMRCTVLGRESLGLEIAIDNDDYYEPQKATYFLDNTMALRLRDWLNEWFPLRAEDMKFTDPESDLFSDAMDRAISMFHSVRHGAMRNAERAGEQMDGKLLARRALAAGITAYLATLSMEEKPHRES